MTAPVGDIYTHGHHDAVMRSHRWRTAENSAAYLLPLLEPGMRVLDVGCGPGTLTAGLAARVAPGSVIGVDIAAAPLAEARAHAADRGIGNVVFVQGDFRSREAHEGWFDDGSFDVVHAHQVLQHLRDPVEALREMARLAKPGGIVAVRDSDCSAMTWAPDDEHLERWRSIYLEVTQRNGAEAEAGRWLLQWAHAAGLSEIAYTTSTWTFATPADRRWWGQLWAERTIYSSFAEQAVTYGIATERELAEVANGWQSWAAQPAGVFVVLHGEVIARA